MKNNDEKIKEVLKAIEDKKKTLGDKPKAFWKSNGIFKFDDRNHVNINTVSEASICVDAVSLLLKNNSCRQEACQMLGVPFTTDSGSQDYIDDFKLRVKIINYDASKKQLDAMEARLKELRSEDAKTADAISDIMRKL